MRISGTIRKVAIPQKLASQIRASIYCLGLFLASAGRANIPLPGGDRIGDRPVDIHLESLKELGVRYTLKEGVISAEMTGEVINREVFLRYPSVGATCNFLIAASTSNRTITLKNVAKEPEVVDLANLLNKLGAVVSGAGSDSITIKGILVRRPRKNSIYYEIIPDRIETGLMIIALAITAGEGTIQNCIPEHNRALINILKKAGVKIESRCENVLYVQGTSQYNPVNILAMPYPGFPTDLQPLLAVFCQKCTGDSTICDLVFPERFTYIHELGKMGATIHHVGNFIQIKGGRKLQGMCVEGSDIRSVAALLCAGLIAKNKTIVTGIYHLNRGHESICSQLALLGADIKFIGNC